ncbi:MAG: hypothetical protein ACOH1H_03295 [Brevundimonas sp.]|jgi:Ca2+-binding EF-hand superfamily protein
MQISSSSAATSSMALNALRDLFQTRTTETTGQNSPTGSTSKSAKGPPSGPPPGPPPAAANGGGFSADTLSALLQGQEGGSGPAKAAIDAADTNGDGTVSLAELAASLGTDAASVTKAFTRVDSDADGQINAGEMEAGLKSLQGRHGPHGPPPSAADVAAGVLASADSDQNGSLSLAEITTTLGQNDPTSLSGTFSALDTNGDGALGADELTSGVQAVFARQMAAYAANTGTTATASRSLAA